MFAPCNHTITFPIFSAPWIHWNCIQRARSIHTPPSIPNFASTVLIQRHPTRTDPIRTHIRSLSVYSHTICICAIGPTPCCTTTILASKYPTRSPILAIAANTCAALNGVSISSIPITCICTWPCLCVKISTGPEALLPPSLSRCVAEKSDSMSRSTVSSTPRGFLPRLTMMIRLLSGIT